MMNHERVLGRGELLSVVETLLRRGIMGEAGRGWYTEWFLVVMKEVHTER